MTPSFILSIGAILLALLTAILTRSFAFWVASSGWFIWTHEHWSLILAIWNRYLFNPASLIVSWNNGSWVLGVHDATITRLRWYSSIFSFIIPWVSAEQVYKFLSVITTFGRVLAYLVTSGTSTYPPILIPQWQINTPIRGGCPATKISGGNVFSVIKVPLFWYNSWLTHPAAALAWVTVSGISFGWEKAPQA